jgi:hypothetical protein
VSEPTDEDREQLDRFARETAPTESAVEQALTRTLVRIESGRRTPNLPGARRRIVWFAAAGLASLAIATGAFAGGRWLRARAQPVEPPHDAAPFDRVDTDVEPTRPRTPTPKAPEPIVPEPIVPEVAELPKSLESAATEPAPHVGEVAVSKPRRRTESAAAVERADAEADEPSSEPPVADASVLAEESRLLARVRRALGDDDFEGALEWAEEHARRHPRGLLTEERLVLEAVAACRGGQHDRGLAAAEQLREQFPGTPTLAKVEQACDQ